MISREQAETNLRQDIQHAWEPWYNRDTINRSQFSRAIRNALAPTLIEQYKAAALVLLRQFIEDDSIDMDEVDELADKSMSEHAAAIAEGVADTTVKWVEDDENPGRAFDRDRAELISITEITRARTMGEMAAAALLEDVDIQLVARWWTADDERVCPVCGPLHKTLEKYWSEFFPRGTPAHPRCRCGIDWKEKAKRKSRRTRKVGRMGRRSRRSGFGRMRSRSREEIEGFEIIKGRFLESKRPKPSIDSANRKSDDSSSLT